MQQDLFNNSKPSLPEGLFKTKISSEDVQKILVYLRDVYIRTPFYHQHTYHGSKINTKQTSIGTWGWTSDDKGYRYERTHPNGNKWLPISEHMYNVLNNIHTYIDYPTNIDLYDSCLINLYRDNSSLGLHVDNTEKDLTFPIVSISIGRSAEFFIENHKEILNNRDVIVMTGKARNALHGVAKLLDPPKQTPLKNNELRLNLTFRKAM